MSNFKLILKRNLEQLGLALVIKSSTRSGGAPGILMRWGGGVDWLVMDLECGGILALADFRVILPILC